jgi:hypothetical protein
MRLDSVNGQAGPLEAGNVLSDRPRIRFAGIKEFRARIRELAAVPGTWRTILAQFAGVYLLCDHTTGKQYVGKADGVGGFWARWEQYAATSHGGNTRIKEHLAQHPGADFHVCVLDWVGSSAPPSRSWLWRSTGRRRCAPASTA